MPAATPLIPMTPDEVSSFAQSVRGTLARHWAGPVAAPEADLLKLWQSAAEQGWLELGAAGALAAAVAAVRELGRAACPLPVMDAFVATRLLAHDENLIDGIGRGEVRVVACVGDGSEPQVRHLDAGRQATHLLTFPATGGTAVLRPVTRTVETAGLAVPAWSTVTPGEPALTTEIDADTADEAVVLLRLQLAVRALSAAEHAHEMAVEHAKQRRQFGKIIGSFGAVQQRTATCQIDVGAGNLLVADAVQALEHDLPDRLLSAEIAVEHARTAAPRVQLGAHHTLAAIGYFEEHDAPWLFRRVHGDIARLRTLPRAFGDVADILVEGTGSLPTGDLGETGEAFRTEVRAFFDTYAEKLGRIEMGEDAELVRAVADRGWLGLTWPEEAGGRSASLSEQVVLNEEAAYRRAPVIKALGAVSLLGDSVLRHGTPEQKERFLPLIRNGQLTFCLGYSEPEAGSDLASLRSRAVRDGEDWVINGQKLWTSGGHEADWVWLAVRTDPEATPRHAGITMFLVPMNTPGITVQQHRALSGEISCTVFYDDVRVPDDLRVGEVNGGWKVITDSLASERVAMGNIAAVLHRQLDDLLALARRDSGAAVGPRGSHARALVTELAVGVQATRVLVAAGLRAAGHSSSERLAAPMAGVLAGELAERFGEVVLDILGPDAALSASAPGALGGGAFEYGLRLSIMYVVGGGTNDIQRGMIARGLGLPR
ncbi:acyl-CoA dehydrogenase family protein [Streptomyces justiciae]|uniref:acyl-CoA dehydrogenase family protein n=1 Tax=Streptomyces justiciae TaxID=2780140 RepID=UPI001D153E6A|nr:acyl-CoA dehydrogenase family protein [Streptomyces justiciae]